MQKGDVMVWKCKNPSCGATLGLLRKNGRGFHQLLFYREAVNADYSGDPPEVAAVLVGLVLDVRCSICESTQPWEPDREALVAMLERIDERRKKAIVAEGLTA